MSRKLFGYSAGSLDLSDGESRQPHDSFRGATQASHAHANCSKGQFCFAADLGSKIEETITLVVSRHKDSGIDRSLAWEIVQTLAQSKLTGTDRTNISEGNQSIQASLYDDPISWPESGVFSTWAMSSLDVNYPTLMEPGPFSQHEQLNGSGDDTNLAIPELVGVEYNDGPFSLHPMSTSNSSSGIITNPSNSPAGREVWPNGSFIDSSTTGSLHTVLDTQSTSGSRLRESLLKRQGNKHTVPQLHSRHSHWPQGVPKSRYKQKELPKNPYGRLGAATERHINSLRLVQDNAMQETLRRPVGRIRKRGRPCERPSCARCKMQKRKCSGGDGETCVACDSSPLYRGLCIPADFRGSRKLLHTLYQTRIQALCNNIAGWIPDEPWSLATVEISNGLGPSIEVTLKAYVPFDKELLTHVLFRGTGPGMVVPRAESTAYSLQYDTISPQQIDEYCDKLAFHLARSEGEHTTERSRLANHILVFATAQCEEVQESPNLEGLNLIKLALRLWAMQVVFFRYPWTIVKGGSQVGMFPIGIPGCWYGKTLLPRLVNQQLDRAFEIRMDELEREILEQLQDMIFSPERNKYWCAIFLATFILLHSLEKDSWNMHAWEFEKNRRGGTPWPLPTDPSEFYRQNEHIADTLATCFRIVMNGHAPFAIDWTRPSNQGLLNGSAAAQRLIENIQEYLQSPQCCERFPSAVMHKAWKNNDCGAGYMRQHNTPHDFRRDDVECLNYCYTWSLILG